MKSVLRLLIVSALFLAVWSVPAAAQDDAALISLYRVAPGQHMAFLEWMANNEAAAQDAGVPAAQWYAHMNGDAWDFIQIGPITTDEQDAAIDAAAQARGLTTGPPAGMEFRRFIAWHTDTYAAGPMTAAELLAGARGN